ncbi:hypothetical protein GCM10020000_41370 [Streptomyces olivoverticillatus]
MSDATSGLDGVSPSVRVPAAASVCAASRGLGGAECTTDRMASAAASPARAGSL